MAASVGTSIRPGREHGRTYLEQNRRAFQAPSQPLHPAPPHPSLSTAPPLCIAGTVQAALKKLDETFSLGGWVTAFPENDLRRIDGIFMRCATQRITEGFLEYPLRRVAAFPENDLRTKTD